MSSLVPAQLLLIYVAVLLPLGLLPVINPALTPAAVVLGLLALVPIAVDFLLSRQRLQGIAFQVPPVIRLSAGRAGDIQVTVSYGANTGAKNPARSPARPPTWITVGLDFPPTIICDQEIITLALSQDHEQALFSFPVLAKERGRFALTLLMAATRSRFGFWEIRQETKLDAEIRVYPNLQLEQKKLASLFMPQRGAGIQPRRQVGQGREFEKLREYLPGDSLDMIHWKATAKRQHPMSKLYQVERIQEVYAVVDAARLSGQPGAEQEQRLESFIRTALVIGMAARQQGDLFGLLTFHHQIGSFMRAKGGAGHFNLCRDQLSLLEMQRVSPDFRELAIFIRNKLKKRALLIFMTSLDDPVLAEELLTSIELICRQHLVVIMTPNTTQPLFADEQVSTVDDIRRNLVGHFQDQDMRTLERAFHRLGVTMLRSEAPALAGLAVQQYLSVKSRQLL
ncbi:DUF58 domain-containing protein [Candidatus Electrothrix sp.]|uniref:DUF58 domain-containing protein n=1 Tax=Candidatus Electrothrix sp. TaxID=2170559 RepID=UPI004057038C